MKRINLQLFKSVLEAIVRWPTIVCNDSSWSFHNELQTTNNKEKSEKIYISFCVQKPIFHHSFWARKDFTFGQQPLTPQTAEAPF